MRLPVGRLAPTPSGRLHLGNVCAFGLAWLSIRQKGGVLLLRIEDLDRERFRAGVEADQRDDLEWLGLSWDHEVVRQSERSYEDWLERVAARCYRCRCTRADVRAAGGVYPGTCRDARLAEGAIRLRLPDGAAVFDDGVLGRSIVPFETVGDPVLRRRDGQIGYQLAVVADDIRDGVTEVVRGADLLEATAVQVVLWEAFGRASPVWCHAPLVLGPDGRKLSKSHGALHVGALRTHGWRPADVWRLVLPWLGVSDAESLDAALDVFAMENVPRGPITVDDARYSTFDIRYSIPIQPLEEP